MLHHLAKQSLLFDEFVGGTLFHYFATMHDNNFIVVCDCYQSMGDGDDGGISELFLQHFLDKRICFDIDIRCGLV